MSYTVSKKITVEYTDHVAELQKNGDTYKAVAKPVTKHKDIEIKVNVDTDPFDASVDDSAHSLENLTGSIVGFKVASVAAKKANEQAVVGHVGSGFLNMIEQNINLQNAGMEAEMHALAGELKQQCDELTHKHEVMNKDFNRIKSRYMGLFEAINKEFKNRMQALIKPCFDFVAQVRSEQNRRVESGLLSMVTTGGQESDSARIAIQASKMKHHAELLINSSKKFILDNKSLGNVLGAFSLTNADDAVYYAPVVIMSARKDSSGQEELQVYLNSTMSDNGRAEEFVRKQQAGFKDAPINAETMKRITSYFRQFLSEFDDGTAVTHRIADQMNRLFEDSNVKTFV